MPPTPFSLFFGGWVSVRNRDEVVNGLLLFWSTQGWRHSQQERRPLALARACEAWTSTGSGRPSATATSAPRASPPPGLPLARGCTRTCEVHGQDVGHVSPVGRRIYSTSQKQERLRLWLGQFVCSGIFSQLGCGLVVT